VNITAPINVTDNKTGTIEMNISVLSPGKSITGTAIYKTTQDDLDRGYVINQAYATGMSNGNAVKSANTTAIVTAIQKPAIITVKSASPTTYDTVGENITYTYTVNNSGNLNILGTINITDNKIGTFKISDSGLAPRNNVTGTANYTITQADLDSGSVTNIAFSTGTINGTKVNSTYATATVTAIQNPGLMMVKLASLDNYDTLGQNVTYTYLIFNSGNVNITGPINVTDNKTGTIKISNNVLSPGKSITGTANYTITQADLDRGFVINEAYAVGMFNGKEVKTTNATAIVTASQKPGLMTVKIASPTNYSTVGQNITYTYTVNNSGNVGITGPINVTDNKTGTVKISDSELAPGKNVTGTAIYKTTQADLDRGYVINEAYATGMHSGKEVKSLSVTANVTAVQSPLALIL
jgi:uncharacterized repeat protein (TIGR01451 family)